MAVIRRLVIRKAVLCALMAVCVLMLLPSQAQAALICNQGTPACIVRVKTMIRQFHAQSEQKMKDHIRKVFGDHKKKDFSSTEGQAPKTHEEWLVNEFFKKQVLPAVQKYSRQSSTVTNQQALARGMMMDADNAVDAQRSFQLMQADAYRSFQPSSDELCSIGTNVRSLGASEMQGRKNAVALSGLSLSRQLGESGTAGATSPDADKQARWNQFVKTYCDTSSNNGDPANAGQSGMSLACGSGAADKTRMNNDVNFSRLLAEARTRDVNYTDSSFTPDEEDIQAFIDNIFPSLSRQGNAAMMGTAETQRLELGLRAVAAKRGVAQNSLNALVGMKSAGKADEGATREYLGAIMKQLGMKDDEIFSVIGENPSYYAQLEVLAKRIYQSPTFYSNLYDTPDNVERKAVALHAIDLMLDRAIYESQLRKEMVVSVLLASELNKESKSVNRSLSAESE